LQDEKLVDTVLEDFETAPLGEREKALFRFVDKVNRDSVSIQAADVELLHGVGWDDEALYDAITVCALFNFYNRWVDATGVHEMSEEGHRESGRRMAARGYVMMP